MSRDVTKEGIKQRLIGFELAYGGATAEDFAREYYVSQEMWERIKEQLPNLDKRLVKEFDDFYATWDGE
jgi:hypothetical protein